MTNKITLQPQADLLSITYFGQDEQAFSELSRLAELVGVDITKVEQSSAQGILQFSSYGVGADEVSVKFHELFATYFRSGVLTLNYQQDSAEILELMVAVGATLRGKVVGVVGAQGGVGTSTLSALIARFLQKKFMNVALVDLNVSSGGLELLLSAVDLAGLRWADLQGKGALLAGRLNISLPKWQGISLLSADDRGAVPFNAEHGSKVISALAQVNEWSVLDLPSFALVPDSVAHTWLQWCDYVVLATDTTDWALADTFVKLHKLLGRVPVAVVARGVKSKNHLAYISQTLQYEQVYPVRRQKGLCADLAHGLAPGERNKSALMLDVRRLCTNFLWEKD